MALALTGDARRQIKPYISSLNLYFLVVNAAEKLTDLGKVQIKIIMIRFNYADLLLTIYFKLAPLGLKHDEDYEASGLACLNQLCEVHFGARIISSTDTHTVYIWHKNSRRQGCVRSKS